MRWSIQGGGSSVHASWNTSPEEAEIPSTFSPLLFMVFNLLCEEKDKSFIMPEVWPQVKVPKRCFRVFRTRACAISAGTWPSFRVTFATIHKLHIPSVLLQEGPSFFSWLAPLHFLWSQKLKSWHCTRNFKWILIAVLGRKHWVFHYWFCYFYCDCFCVYLQVGLFMGGAAQSPRKAAYFLEKL